MRLYVDAVLNHAAMLTAPGVEELRWLRPVTPGVGLRGRTTILEAGPPERPPGGGALPRGGGPAPPAGPAARRRGGAGDDHAGARPRPPPCGGDGRMNAFAAAAAI